MENPMHWNKAVKLLNSINQKLTADVVITALAKENLLIGPSNNLHNVIDAALQQHKEDMDNQLCGFSVGMIIYNKLKEVGAIE